MKKRFPKDWRERIVITVDEDFRRKNDVIIQTGLASSGLLSVLCDNTENVVKTHIWSICKAVKFLQDNNRYKSL